MDLKTMGHMGKYCEITKLLFDVWFVIAQYLKEIQYKSGI